MNNAIKKIIPVGTKRHRIAQSVYRNLYAAQEPWCSPQEITPPFFIVGSGRCGTTLLRRLLQANPDVHIPPENWAMRSWVKQFGDYRGKLSWEELCGVLLNSLLLNNQGWFESIPIELLETLINIPNNSRSLANFIDTTYRYHGRKNNKFIHYWGDKTPLNINNIHFILKIFPNAKFVFLLRDPADVIYSWSKLPIYYNDLIKPAFRWNSAFESYLNARSADNGSLLMVRYEELVTNTENELLKVSKFLDINFQKDWINKEDHFSQMKDLNKWNHLTHSMDPVTHKSIGKGRSALSQVQLEKLHHLIGKTVEKSGYPPLMT